jgi:microcystin-dependent protein
MARQPFNTRWAQGVESESSLNSFQAPSDIRMSTGWEGGQDKDAPPAGQENWWHNRVDTALQGVERNGVMSWHPQAVYGLGAPSYGSDGNYYESLANSNSGNNPVTTIGFWRYCGPSFFSGHSPGDLKMVAHNNIPTTGWLKCNGALLLRSSYQLLFSVIGTSFNTGGETALQFRIPDARGGFARGFDDGSGVDAGRVFGAPQSDALKSHELDVTAAWTDGLDKRVYMAGVEAVSNSYVASLNFNPTQAGRASGFLKASVSGGSETRPKNFTVNYWIRY